jgi:hypothetical protein
MTHFIRVTVGAMACFTCTRSLVNIILYAGYGNLGAFGAWFGRALPDLFFFWGMAIGWGLSGFMFSPVKATHAIPLGIICTIANSMCGVFHALGEAEIAAELDSMMSIVFGVIILGALISYMCLSTRRRVAFIAFIPIVLTVAISLAADFYVAIYEALPVQLRPFLLSMLNSCYVVLSTRLITIAHDRLWRPGMSYVLLWALAALVHVYPQYIRLAGVTMTFKLNPDPAKALPELCITLAMCLITDVDRRNHIGMSFLNKLGFPWAPQHFFLDLHRQLSFVLSYIIYVPFVPTLVTNIISMLFGRPKEGSELFARWDLWVGLLLNMMFLIVTDLTVICIQRRPGETVTATFYRLHTGGAHTPLFDSSNRNGRPHTSFPAAESPEGLASLGIGPIKQERLDFHIFGKVIPEHIMFVMFVSLMLMEGWQAGWLYMTNAGNAAGHPYKVMK